MPCYNQSDGRITVPGSLWSYPPGIVATHGLPEVRHRLLGTSNVRLPTGSPWNYPLGIVATRSLPGARGRLRERAKSYAKALANDILR
ncbi:hypothetical protein EGJ44_15600 [Ectopseudomonas oleovorans]|uniref:Uncharacterized protein n=1 Tax=Ectopseudomonas oleovorans TaxID=301 RepID=A0A3R8XQ79_ECTOL|nr:hypothetical protein EGJ44_15600 [Pseudomonas oleovorans]